MSENVTSTDAGKSAGDLLLGKKNDDNASNNNNNQDENRVSVDARGVGDFNLFSKRKNSSATSSCIKYYNMEFQNRGYAVIINNENFYSCTGMNRRVGTDIDARNLKSIFMKLGFYVDVKNDIRCLDLHGVIEDYAKMDHSDSDCFMFAILSHGDNGCIYGTDGIIKIKTLVDKFRGDKCPSLAGKPKIFMFQACRGTEYEMAIEPSKDTVDGPATGKSDAHMLVVDSGPIPTIPSGSDFLFCYSVTEGFYSFRDTLYGSWFVQEFTDVMETLFFHVPEEKREAIDFIDILTAVNHKVSQRQVSRTSSRDAMGKKQMPCFLSMLTKKLYLLPKNNKRSKKSTSI